LYDKYKHKYRYECKLCGYRTYYPHGMLSHAVGLRHKHLKQKYNQDFDYHRYKSTYDMEVSATEEGEKVSV
jgi:hypothetical protein